MLSTNSFNMIRSHLLSLQKKEQLFSNVSITVKSSTKDKAVAESQVANTRGQNNPHKGQKDDQAFQTRHQRGASRSDRPAGYNGRSNSRAAAKG